MALSGLYSALSVKTDLYLDESASLLTREMLEAILKEGVSGVRSGTHRGYAVTIDLKESDFSEKETAAHVASIIRTHGDGKIGNLELGVNDFEYRERATLERKLRTTPELQRAWHDLLYCPKIGIDVLYREMGTFDRLTIRLEDFYTNAGDRTKDGIIRFSVLMHSPKSIGAV